MEDRISRLESQVRTMRVVSAALVLAVLGAFAAGWATSEQRSYPDIEARSITIVGDDNRTMATIGPDENGQAQVYLIGDREGESISLHFGKNGPVISAKSGDDTFLATAGTEFTGIHAAQPDNGSVLVSVSPNGGSEIVCKNTSKGRVGIRCSEQSAGAQLVWNEEITVSTTSDGKSSTLRVFDGGEVAAAFGTIGTGGAIVLFDKDGAATELP